MSEFMPMLRLDLETLGSTRRMLLIYLGLAMLFAASGGVAFALPLIAMVGVLVGLTLFGTAETNRLTQLYGSLPLRRRTVVLSHYLVVAAVTVVGVPVGVGVAVVAAAFRREPLGSVWLGAVGTVGMLFVVLAILLPVIIKWGSRLGSWIMLLSVFVVSGVAVYAGTLPGVSDIVSRVAANGVVPWVMLGVGVLAMVLSAPVATRIYARQDH